jgi:hypothetical protein
MTGKPKMLLQIKITKGSKSHCQAVGMKRCMQKPDCKANCRTVEVWACEDPGWLPPMMLA